MSKRRGLYIAFEGIDGCGKGTQIKMLKQKLPEITSEPFLQTCEPSNGPIGKVIRSEYLSGKRKSDPDVLSNLYVIDRIDNLTCEDGVISQLEAGNIVISDRCFLSSCAYQGMSVFDKDHDGYLLAENDFADTEDSPSIKNVMCNFLVPAKFKDVIYDILNLNQKIFSLAIPDVIFYLDIPADEAMKRIDKRSENKEIFEDQTKLAIARTMYRQVINIISTHPFNIFTKVYVLDGTLPPEKISESIKDYIDYELKSRGND